MPPATDQIFDVIIVGSGPAGTATALHLCRRDRAWARRILILDRAVHPREKLCGGGVTHYGEEALAELGLTVEPRFFSVREVRLVHRNLSYLIRGNPAFRIVRRDEFDHWLVRETRAKGVTIHEGETLREIRMIPGEVRGKDKTSDTSGDNRYVEVTTDRGTYHARVLVGADGSKSLVRRLAGFADARAQSTGPLAGNLARLVEVLTPEDPDTQPEFREHRAVFDFSRMTDGLQGYYWDFPSLIQGSAFMNRGLFDSRIRTERARADLVPELAAALAERDRNLDDCELKGHPIHWFDPRASFARPRILLVGDAAGVDPLFGEGIAFAIAYGGPAADAIVDAFARDDFRFADYGRRLMSRPVFRHLRLRVRLARIAYSIRSPWFVNLCWRIARIAVRLTPWRSSDYVPTRARAFPRESN